MTEPKQIFSNNHSQKESYVLVIGDINIDVSAVAEEEIVTGELQFGRVEITLGGVGRNVALNLKKLGVPVVFLTAVGADIYGKEALKQLEEAGVDMNEAILLEKERSASILYLDNQEGETHSGIEDLKSLDYISPKYLKEKSTLIDGAERCIVSGNLTRESLDYLTETHQNTNFFFDPASEKMADQVSDIIGNFHTIKPNEQEGAILSNREIENEKDIRETAEKIYKKGAEQVFLTLDDGGITYLDGESWKIKNSPKVEPISTTGAGDALSAALNYCFYHQLDLEYSVRFALAASTLTLYSEKAVHPDFSVDKIEEMMRELEGKG